MRRWWTKKDIDLLVDKYSELGPRGLSPLLKRTPTSVRNKARNLSIKYLLIKKINIQLTEREIGYIAGLVDGEGTITVEWVNNHGYPRGIRPTLIISNTDKELLLKCQKLIGGHIYVHNNKPNRKICYTLQVLSIGQVLSILELILPELVTKKERARLLLEFCKNRAKQYSKSPYSTNELRIAKEIKELNLRSRGRIT